MVVGGGSSPPPELTTFRRLVAARSKRKIRPNQQKFVKKLDNIPSIDLPAEHPCQIAMNIAYQGLIVQFTGL